MNSNPAIWIALGTALRSSHVDRALTPTEIKICISFTVVTVLITAYIIWKTLK